LRTPPNRHHTLSLVLLGAGFTSTTLAPPA
jgi:hypothetical protein